MSRLPCGLPRRHPIQGHRNAPHIVLREDQAEQGGKLLQLHGTLIQLYRTLLQPAAQNRPQLPVLLRQGWLFPAPQLRNPLFQAFRQPNFLQKIVKGNCLTPSCVVLVLS